MKTPVVSPKQTQGLKSKHWFSPLVIYIEVQAPKAIFRPKNPEGWSTENQRIQFTSLVCHWLSLIRNIPNFNWYFHMLPVEKCAFWHRSLDHFNQELNRPFETLYTNLSSLVFFFWSNPSLVKITAIKYSIFTMCTLRYTHNH